MFMEKIDQREKLHFLHIGKNAGTQFRHVAEQVNALSKSVRIITHRHSIRLKHLPTSEGWLFSVRSPESRFKSGFYSRIRKGQPRIYSDWSKYERMAFSYFEHANDLAEALFEDGERGFHALCAIKSIYHCSLEQIDYFEAGGYFFEINPPLAIIRQEEFSHDLKLFLEQIAFQGEVSLITDSAAAHMNDYSCIPPFSEKAKRNLYEWYRQDFEFYKQCEYWIKNK